MTAPAGDGPRTDTAERLAEAIDAHWQGAEMLGDRQLRATCRCGEWRDEFSVGDSPSVAWGEAAERWRNHRAQAVAVLVASLAREQAAEELDRLREWLKTYGLIDAALLTILRDRAAALRSQMDGPWCNFTITEK